MNKSYLDHAGRLDEQHPLSGFRSRFVIADDTVYLDGNSLGRLPGDTVSYMEEVITSQWGRSLIRSWNEGWYTLSSRLTRLLAPLVGAGPEELIFCDSTSVNLYKLIRAGLKLNAGRHKVVSDDLNFPTDLYIIQGILKDIDSGHELHLAHSKDGITLPEQQLRELIDEDTALVVLSHTAFKSGALYDMQQMNSFAHQRGALVLWDLSHSVGALPVHLSDTGSDFAVGCSYKYLNGGPGAPAFLYCARSLQEKVSSPIWGWFGEAHPFDFQLSYTPAEGMRKFLAGTPPVLSLAPLECSLKLFQEAGIETIRSVSLSLSEYLISLVSELLVPRGISIGSPLDSTSRGSHITLRHREAYRICRSLIEPKDTRFPKVIPDFREPDNIRLGITPLYTTYRDICTAVLRTAEIIDRRAYEQWDNVRHGVT